MIAIANDKLFSESELLRNVRTYVKEHKIQDIEKDGFAAEVFILSVALDEPEDFVRGAIMKGGVERCCGL